MKQDQKYILKTILISFISLIPQKHLHAGSWMSTQKNAQENSSDLNTLLTQAMALDAQGKCDEAVTCYDTIINAQNAISQLQFKARLNKAKILCKHAERDQQSTYGQEASQLLAEVVQVELDQVNKIDWVEARLLDAQMHEQGLVVDALSSSRYYIDDVSSYNAVVATLHYSKILRKKDELTPLLTFKAAFRWAQLIYESPEKGLVSSGDRDQTRAYVYKTMLMAYDAMTEQEKRENIAKNSRLDAIRLAYASGHCYGDGGCASALKVYQDIIQSPALDVDPKIRNRARANIAGMYLRGEGLPNNTPDREAADTMYSIIVSEPQEDVLAEDRTRAAIALKLIQKTKK